MPTPIVTRRGLLQGALVGSGAALLAACTSTDTAGSPMTSTGATIPTTASSGTPTPMFSTTGNRTLLAYFSRPGENYWNGGRRDLDVGNTEVLATMIGGLISCDVFRIEAADPYSVDYDDTVDRNVREQDADARPAITNPLPSLEAFDAILVGSPIWNVRPPQIMSTFIEGVDVSGKRLLPFVTYAVSGLGSAQRDYEALAPDATVLDGLAVRGEQVADAQDGVERWLRDAGLLA